MCLYSVFFSTNRRMIFLCFAAPILFLSIFYFSLFFYFRINIRHLEERKELIRSLFAMTQKVEEAKEMFSRYSNTPPNADTTEIVNSEFNKIAVNSDFNISSLTVGSGAMKKPQLKTAADKNTTVFTVSIKGWGNASSITRFFNAVYTSFQLISVETANINITDLSSKNNYNADFVFSCYYLK